MFDNQGAILGNFLPVLNWTQYPIDVSTMLKLEALQELPANVHCNQTTSADMNDPAAGGTKDVYIVRQPNRPTDKSLPGSPGPDST